MPSRGPLRCLVHENERFQNYALSKNCKQRLESYLRKLIESQKTKNDRIMIYISIER